MTALRTLVATVLVALASLTGPAAHADLAPPPLPIGQLVPTTPLVHPSHASVRFTKADDTKGLRSHPRGRVYFAQAAVNGPVTATGRVRGLGHHKRYVTVPYLDGACAPAIGVTAFPSKAFTTDRHGRAHFHVTVNPQTLNPLGMFDLRQTHSVSIRRVVASAAGQNVPLAVPETCDTHPRRS